MTSIDTPVVPGPVTRKGSKGAGPSRRRARAGRLFVAPNLAAVAVFMLFPLGFSLYMSFQQWDVFRPPKFVGLKNFEELFTSDPLFLIAIRNTVIFTLGTVVPTVLFSLIVAGVLNRKVRGIGIFRTIVFLPLAISSVVMAVVWQFVFNTDNGLLNIMLGWLGIGPIPWLVDPRWAMVSLCIVSVWRSVPFATVILLAAMQGVPETLYEAAKIDGAGEIRQFAFITVPLIRGAMSFVVVISIIHAFQAFDMVYDHHAVPTRVLVPGIRLRVGTRMGDVRHFAGVDRVAVAAHAAAVLGVFSWSQLSVCSSAMSFVLFWSTPR
jgi:multiple sugar transport system permease protein